MKALRVAMYGLTKIDDIINFVFNDVQKIDASSSREYRSVFLHRTVDGVSFNTFFSTCLNLIS